MNLRAIHPLYSQYIDDWIMMRDLYRGERIVKSKDELYLPPTKGMILDGMSAGQVGRNTYDAYKLRAVFPDYVKIGVESHIGVMHQNAATIELPKAMEGLREKATVGGETLDLLLRRVNEEQLKTGRLGLLLDFPENPNYDLPYISLYHAESIRNWDDGTSSGGLSRLNLVILDESGYIRTSNLSWVPNERYRILILGDINENEYDDTGANYYAGAFSAKNSVITFDQTQLIMPTYHGKPLQEIPFCFINTKDIVPNPDDPPLLALGQLSLAIYRGEADYRQNLFMQGQDTLVIVGGQHNELGDAQSEPLRIGAGSRIDIDAGGDAKYIGVNAAGLTEQRTSLENDRIRAEQLSGQLISNKRNQAESGSALQTRINAQTATLNQVALAGAAGLENLLKKCAKWMGANPDEVKVTPNLEFASFTITGQDLVQFMTARSMGAPLSKRTIHDYMVENRVTKLDYETEMELLQEEDLNLVSKDYTIVSQDEPQQDQMP